MPNFYNTVSQILAAGEDLIPWIEERAFQYSMHRFALPARVLTMSDMRGWNTRKVSDYKAPGMANAAQEYTDLTETQLIRKRLAEISPSEWGDRYFLSNARLSTDPEDPRVQVVQDLGYSLGLRREKEIYDILLAGTGPNMTIGGAYTLGAATAVMTMFEAQAINDQIFHVIHPYQELDVLDSLLNLSTPAVPEFRNRFVNSWSFPGFANVNIAAESFVPRNVIWSLDFTGSTAGDFTLRIGGYQTGDITWSATEATLVTNIETALDALGDGQDWSGSVSTNGEDEITITMPTGYYVSQPFELAVGVDENGDPVKDAGVTFTVSERSATARAPIFVRNSVIHDVRQGMLVNFERLHQGRTLEIGASSVFGVGGWRYDRAGWIETDASAPNAIGAP